MPPTGGPLRCAFRLRSLGLNAARQISKRRKDRVEFHSATVIGIDVTRLDEAIPADNEGRGDRQHPGFVALIGRYIEAARLHRLALLVADPEQEIEFERVAIVDVGENRK